MSKERLTLLIQKYADQNCTREEYAELMTLINEEHNSEELDRIMDKEWEKQIDSPKLAQGKVDQMFRKLMTTGEFESGDGVGLPVKPNRNRSWMIGAAATVLLGIFVFLYNNPTEAPSAVNEVKTTARSIQPLITVSAAAEHRRISLPDGSVVILNSGSTLDFPEKFLGESREVVLKGEAYFDIKHHAEQRFIVHTGKVSTTVLGTAFNIKAHDKASNVVVTVTRGKVLVKNEQETLGIIVPNQQIVFDKVRNKSALLSIQAAQTIAWQQKDLFFDDVTMEEAAIQLAKRFSISIRFTNEASKSCRFSATFLKEEALDEILQVITSFNHMTYQKKAGEVMLSGNGCK